MAAEKVAARKRRSGRLTRDRGTECGTGQEPPLHKLVVIRSCQGFCKVFEPVSAGL